MNTDLADVLEVARPDIGHLDYERFVARTREALFGVSAAPVRRGRFTILERLGQGGMGVVYSAYDPQLDRKVALKFLHPQRGSDDSEARQRLRREAQALAKLSHPNVTQVYEVVELQGDLIVVMEQVAGPTLDEWLHAEPRNWRDVLDVYIPAARGLAAAHRAGVVHRDFKPSNVLMGEENRIRVADFGLARGVDDDSQVLHDHMTEPDAPALGVELTITGTVLGTPAYLAPECHDGAAANATSDQFSFCVALYEGLYGMKPFTGESITELIVNSQSFEITPVEGRDVPRWLFDAVARGLSRDPEQRWPSMDHLIAALEADPGRKWRQRRRVFFTVLAIASVVLGLGWATYRAVVEAQRERAAKERAFEELKTEVRRQRDLIRMAVAVELKDDPTKSLAAFREIEDPSQILDFDESASILLRSPIAESILEGHTNAVVQVAFSPDGDRAVTISRDREARVWTVGRHAEPVVLQGHRRRLRSVAFSSDGRLIATTSNDGTVRVWNADGSGAPRVLDHGAPTLSVLFCQDGTALVATSSDGMTRLWRLDDPVGDPASSTLLEQSRRPVHALALGAHGDHLVTVSPDGRVWRWRWDGRLLGVTNGGSIPSSITAAVFSRDGGRAVMVSRDGIAWIRATEGEGNFVSLTDPTGAITLAEPSEDGSYVATASADGTVRLWHSDGTAVGRVFAGHTAPVTSMAFHSNRGRLATASRDGTVRLWHTREARAAIVLRGHPGVVDDVVFSPDGQRVISAGRLDHAARIWRVPDRAKMAVLSGHTGPILSLQTNPQGTMAVTASVDGTARIWPLESNASPTVLSGHRDDVRKASFSPDGQLVLTASRDGSVHLWTLDGAELYALEGDRKAVATAIFLGPQGERIAVGYDSGMLRIWEPVSGKVFELRRHTDRVFRLEPCPTGGRLLTLSGDGTARLWSVSQSERELVFTASHDAGLYTGHCSRDGTQFATADLDGIVRVWSVPASGSPVRLVATLDDHVQTVTSVRFSPDGMRLLTGSRDTTVRLTELPTEEVLAVFHGRDWQVSNNFSPDGTRIVAGSLDGTARVWNADGSGPVTVLRGHGSSIQRSMFAGDETRVLTSSRDGTVRLWHDLYEPTDRDAAFWKATTYCMPAAQRQRLMGSDSERATREQARCRDRVALHLE